MLLITSLTHEEVDLAFKRRSACLPSSCRTGCHGRYTYFSTGDYEVQTVSESLIFHKGRAFRDDAEIRVAAYADIHDFAADLKEAVGYFSSIFVNASRLMIISSLYRHGDVFYAADGDDIIVSTDMACLLTILGPRRINRDFVFDFLFETWPFGGETFFEEVFHVPHGEAVALEHDRPPRRQAWNIPKSRTIDLVAELRQSIGWFAKREERIFVHFSGGLDSSLVLHAAQKVDPECVAIHLLSLEDSASELHIAEQVAAEFSAELRTHSSPVRFSEPRTSFEPTGYVSSPFDIHPLSPDPSNRDFAYDEQMQSAGIDGGFFVTGQGGDYVFLQNPAPHVGYDGYKEGGIRGFLSAVKKYSLLKKVPILLLLQENIRVTALGKHPEPSVRPNWARGHLQFRSRVPHSLLQGVDTRSAKYTHLHSVISGLYQMKPVEEASRYRVLHPIFLQNVIAGIRTEPVNNLYNSDYDRVAAREALARSSGSSVAWRRTKRPSSGLVFAFFRNNEETLKTFLSNGIVSISAGIDPVWIDDEVTRNANVGLAETMPLMLNLLRLEMYAKSFSPHIAVE